MKVVAGIRKVTLKRGKNFVFAIEKPDVFKSNCSDTYIVFGEAKMEDVNAAQAQALSQALQNVGMDPEMLAQTMGQHGPGAAAATSKVEDVAADDTDDVDETGLEAKDIDLVMSQVQCSRAKAVKALKQNKGDIVEAIMSLSAS